MSDDPPPDGAVWANLGFEEGPTPFASPSQRARVLTEGWAARWMFCPQCGTAPLDPFPNNSKVADFRCAACDEEYELKAQAIAGSGRWSRTAPTARRSNG